MDIALVICAVALLVLLVRTVSVRRQLQPIARLPLAEWQALATKGNRIGPAAAVITVVEFADFQCGSCRELAHDLRILQAKHPSELVVVYRHLPLREHLHARRAAIASECAAMQGHFRAYHDILYDKQDSIGKLSWNDFAIRAGVRDTVGFNECVHHARTGQRVAEDSVAAARLGLAGTPAFLVNDALYLGAPPSEMLTQLVLSGSRLAKFRWPGTR